MANVQHNALTDPELHEPKGVASATSGQVYVADGAGSGDWDGADAIDATIDTTGSNGYVILPGAIYLQWGQVTVSGGAAQTVTFPTAFPNAVKSVVLTVIENNNNDKNDAKVGTQSASSFTARNTHGDSLTYNWMAVGH